MNTARAWLATAFCLVMFAACTAPAADDQRPGRIDGVCEGNCPARGDGGAADTSGPLPDVTSTPRPDSAIGSDQAHDQGGNLRPDAGVADSSASRDLASASDAAVVSDGPAVVGKDGGPPADAAAAQCQTLQWRRCGECGKQYCIDGQWLSKCDVPTTSHALCWKKYGQTSFCSRYTYDCTH